MIFSLIEASNVVNRQKEKLQNQPGTLVMSEFAEEKGPSLTPRQTRRQEEREAWEAYWQVRRIQMQGTIIPTIRYYAHQSIDKPVTWFRENVAEPLQDRFKMPYYHRKRSRMPEIDECSVQDYACIWEANEQFRLDKMIDMNILHILKRSLNQCMLYNHGNGEKCVDLIEDFEQNEYNFFVKYGELGANQSVIGAYMKQKHRLVWERRNPEVMEARQMEHELHKQEMEEGHYDRSFWRKGMTVLDKQNYLKGGHIHQHNRDLSNMCGEPEQESKDWQYWKKVKEDPKARDDPGWKARNWLWQ